MGSSIVQKKVTCRDLRLREGPFRKLNSVIYLIFEENDLFSE